MPNYEIEVGKFTQKDKDRFWTKVAFSQAGCWLWTGKKSRGYGQFCFKGRNVSTHRIAYVLIKGPIPHGLTMDHLCRQRNCVKPEHLEAVTNKVNCLRGSSFSAVNARKTHCIRGHEFTAENIRPMKDGKACLQCYKLNLEKGRLSRGLPHGLRTHCPKGHAYDEDNTRLRPKGRGCRACERVRHRARREKLKLQKAVQNG